MSDDQVNEWIAKLRADRDAARIEVAPCPNSGLTSCGNCAHHALDWRINALTGLATQDPVQLAMW